MPKVSVVIPNYNGEKYLGKCLRALNKQSFSDFELIIVDNASPDNYEEIIVNEYPSARLIKLDKNYGFARAVNEGIKAADGEYVFLLNNDTEPDEDCIAELVKVICARNDIFSVGAKMLQMYRRELIDSAGDLYCALGWAFSRGKDSDCSHYDRKAYVFSNCAGASIYRKDLLFELGLFDERHESYLEDVDIGYRARINGYRNVYVPKAYVYHAGSGVSGSRHNEFKVNLSARNSVFLAYKNMPLLQLLINLPFLIVGHVVKLCFFAGKGLAVSYVKGLVAGIKLCFKSEKYTFSSKFIINYVKIQLELWINLGLRFFGNSGN